MSKDDQAAKEASTHETLEFPSDFKEAQDKKAAKDYIDEIKREQSNPNRVSATHGRDASWIIDSTRVMPGHELGMKNSNPYLVLFLKSGTSEKKIRMGGAFEKHIPLIKRLADTLVGKSIEWQTWNSIRHPEKWSDDLWFYRINERIDDPNSNCKSALETSIENTPSSRSKEYTANEISQKNNSTERETPLRKIIETRWRNYKRTDYITSDPDVTASIYRRRDSNLWFVEFSTKIHIKNEGSILPWEVWTGKFGGFKTEAEALTYVEWRLANRSKHY